MPTSTQVVKCPRDSLLPYTIKFFYMVPDPQPSEPGQPQKFVPAPITTMKKDSSNYWVGVSGDVNIVYSYNPVNPSHVIEKNRLSNLYTVTELDYDRLNVYVDFDTYSDNEWQIHDSSKEGWASSVFSYITIKPHSKDVMMAHVEGGNSDNIRYVRLNDTNLILETPGTKSVAVYGGHCSISDSEHSEETNGTDSDPTVKFSGNTTFTSTTSCAVLVITDTNI
jgi:hypothetical protein